MLSEALLEVGDLGVYGLHLRGVGGQAAGLDQADAHVFELADVVLEAGEDGVGRLRLDRVGSRLPVQEGLVGRDLGAERC